MDFQLSPEQEEFRKTVRNFAEQVIAPRAEEMDRTEEFPLDIVAQMGEMGLFGLPFPETYGGMGADFLALCLAIEEISRVDASMGITLEAAVGLGASPIYRFGSEEQKQRWLVPLARGTSLGAFGLTEPEAGSDTAALTTRAVLEGGEWVVDGTKCFITNAGTEITSLVTVTAVTGQRSDGRKEISNIIVPAGTAGLSTSKKYSKVGWHASDTREVSLAGVRVPEENLLGNRGDGLRNFLKILVDGRIAIAAMSVGIAQGCIDESIKYAKEREAFGRPIAKFQAVAFKIADMEMRTYIARLAYYDACARKLAGLPYNKQAYISKLFASESAVTNAREAVQIHGGYGYMNEYPVARFYRDSKVLEIGEGTSEIQRILIARELGLG